MLFIDWIRLNGIKLKECTLGRKTDKDKKIILLNLFMFRLVAFNWSDSTITLSPPSWAIWQHLETFLIDTSGEGMLLPSSRWRPWVLLPFIVRDSFFTINKQLAQNVRVLKLRNSELRRQAMHIKNNCGTTKGVSIIKDLKAVVPRY